MSILAIVLLTILLVIVIIGVVMFIVYNRLTVLKNRFQNALAQIDVQMKRRYDLIPNLVNSARAYITHERETLEAVIKARDAASNALKGLSGGDSPGDSLKNISSADLALGGALGRLMAVMENYPDLKADRTISDLSSEISSTENRISSARQIYNDSVMNYNQSREVFPNILFSKLFGFAKADLWELSSPKEAAVPVVNL
jgi:LemA protein